MKTTLEISDHLLMRAKALARKRKTTLRSLTEEGLRLILETNEGTEEIRVEPKTFRGNGLKPEFRDAGWSVIRDAVYGDR